MNRRELLKYASLSPLVGSVSSVFADNKTLAGQLSQSLQRPDRIVLMVELRGGNDGLNTLVPFEDELYYNLRPNIAVKNSIPLKKDDLGVNPYLKSLLNLWEEGDMAWVQGVGYPNASRSHFHSSDIWESGSLDGKGSEGWISQVLEHRKQELNGIVLGDSNLGPMAGEEGRSVAMMNPEEFLRQTKYLNKQSFETGNDALSHMLDVQNQINLVASLLEDKMKKAKPSPIRFPNTVFGRNLNQIDKMITNGMHLPVYKVTLDGFDTHANQRDVHNNLMNHLGQGLAAFTKSMKHNQLWNNVLIVTYSEFGRRVRENGSFGTDHGSGSANMVLGGAINGGLYGKTPSLKEEDLVNGDLAHTVDFREIYATVAQRWWRRPSPWGNAHRPVLFV